MTVRPSRALASVALVAALTGLAACSGSDQPAPAPATSAATAGTAPGGAPTSAPPPAATTPVPPPTPGDTASTVAPRPVETRKPVKLDQPAQPADAVSVRIARLRAVQAKAQGPGEVSGPGLEVRVEVRNARSTALDLTLASVTLTAANDDPGQLISSGTRPLPASAAAGASVTGTYVFTVPTSQRNPVRVVVTSVADAPVVAFEGPAPR